MSDNDEPAASHICALNIGSISSLTQTLLELEKRLMDPEVRRGDAASELIADDFMEFAGNGRIFNKADALAVMRRHAPRISAMEEFGVRELSPAIALATSRTQPRERGISGPRLRSQFNLGAAER